MEDVLIEVKNLKKYFPIKDAGFFSKETQYVKAVDGLTFSINKGETLGFVGESGCGKSTTGRTMIRLIEPTDGEVLFEGKNIFKLNKNQMRQMRKEMQIIFQDPYASLDPRKTVYDIVIEGYKIHKETNKKERMDKVAEILNLVGLRPEHAKRYPHEFSGGQRQRIGIARSLILEPKFVVCDEPVSALDVSIQSQIINLMKGLQEKLDLTYLFISHDLRVVKHISDRVGVMYLGSIVELADKHDLFRSPLHPYTRALLSAIPIIDPDTKRKRIILQGDVPSPVNPPSGCKFHTRCSEAQSICKEEVPELREMGNGHYCACHMR